jgi:hypothetical protein
MFSIASFLLWKKQLSSPHFKSMFWLSIIFKLTSILKIYIIKINGINVTIYISNQKYVLATRQHKSLYNEKKYLISPIMASQSVL